MVDHGLSLGIYFRDPDGNGVEVSYELSASALEPTEAELAVGHERAHVELVPHQAGESRDGARQRGQVKVDRGGAVVARRGRNSPRL